MMSIPLLSVCLATLMALFRDPDVSTRVSQDDLTLLIRETGAALLDPRLSATSELDDATASQMARAINKVRFGDCRATLGVGAIATNEILFSFNPKLAVQAATGASRHTSLLALMALQQQLSLEAAPPDCDEAFNGRLSRVVSKLFQRVIKAEETVNEPFGASTVDLEAIVCSMDDLLVACHEAESEGVDEQSTSSCKQMVDMLVQSIAKARGAQFLIDQMEELGIDPDSSSLGRAVALVCEAIGERTTTRRVEEAPVEAPHISAPSPSLPSTAPKSPSKDVATLVSTLGNAAPGQKRDAALEALRDYKASYGDNELNTHLEQVSAPFRAFIQAQLAEDDRSQQQQQQPSTTTAGAESGSMSERLRNLRSRLQATELAVQSAVQAPPPPPTKPRSSRASLLAQPSPSKLAVRLRPDSSSSSTATTTIGSSMGRAAALRARLEAVKKNKTVD